MVKLRLLGFNDQDLFIKLIYIYVMPIQESTRKVMRTLDVFSIDICKVNQFGI